jgi:hypothetical protein
VIDGSPTRLCLTGDPTFSEVLYCPEALSITPSLHSALKRLRRKALTILVWADAVCINQNNIKEKNEQVPLMNKIYRQAGRVAVFLGAESDNSQLVPEYIDWKGHEISPGVWSNSSERDRQAKRAFDTMLQRSWFTRLWVIQEIALAAAVDVLCGLWVLYLDEIVAGVLQKPAQTDIRRDEKDLRSLTTLSIAKKQCLLMEQLHLQHKRKEEINMISLLSRTTGSIASNPKDYLYGGFWG